MNLLSFNFDKETTKQLSTEIFKPYFLSISVGLGASIVITLVAAAILGFNAQNGAYSFNLNHSDAWIIFTIFLAISIVVAVISYYRFREEHQKLVDDYLTPFRKELEGEWRVYWTDKGYLNENGQPGLKDQTQNDSCQFGIDNVGKLYIESELHNHPLLEDWKKRVEDISINLQENRLIFYDEAPFTIRKETMKIDDENRTFDARFFVLLEVKESDEQKKVTKYEGRWYDLDGTFGKFKETLTRKLHPDLPPDAHFPRSGTVMYQKAPKTTRA